MDHVIFSPLSGDPREERADMSGLISSIVQGSTVADWLAGRSTDAVFLDMCALRVGGRGQWLYLPEVTIGAVIL